ncbi:protein phosphatase 1 regulatory subunit 3G [Aplochiton taeniatus]
MRDRRRAKSLPAYPEQASLFDEISDNSRKRVKFADTMGLNLASVKHFSSADDPQIPSMVLSRLQSFPPQQHDREIMNNLCMSFTSTLTMDRLVPTFRMPVEADDFNLRLQQRRVTLEKIHVTQFDVRGQIRTRSHNSSKREVGVRYTFNDWLSYVDAQALPMPVDPEKEVGERFTFTMYTPPFLDISCSVHFAAYLRNDEGEFWDNNEGLNYTLRYQSMPTYESAAFHAT